MEKRRPKSDGVRHVGGGDKSMLAVDVPSQVDLALERPLLADVARERLEPGVLATVREDEA